MFNLVWTKSLGSLISDGFSNDSHLFVFFKASFLASHLDSSIFARSSTSIMYWTLELASYLEDAPWPATKDELIDFAMRTGAPLEVVENLQQLEDEGDAFETIEDIWPDYPSKEDFFFNEDEY